MEFKQILKHIFNRFQNGFQYKKTGKDISQKSAKLVDGLYVGVKIQYNVRSAFHSIK